MVRKVKRYKKKGEGKNNIRVFVDIGKALTSVLELKGVLNTIMQKISELFKVKNWSLLLIDEEKNELYFEIAVGIDLEKVKDIRLKIGEGIAGWVAKHRVPLVIPDVQKDRRWTDKVDRAAQFDTKSLVCVPLISKEKLLGVIELVNVVGKRKSFTEEDLILLQTFADYAAIAIENARYLQKIEELTIKDDVTGLFNSRYLHRALEQEVIRAQRYKEHFSLIFIDIDHFKVVNDTYGHLIGSRLLKEVAEVIKKTLRETDIATRYGGDEFVLILPETTKENAYKVAKRLRENINSTNFISSDGINVKITASYGIATYPVDATDRLELLKLADQAMYRVKETTRDGIAMA